MDDIIHTHSLSFLCTCRPGAARRRDASACFLQTNVQTHVLRQPLLWLTESQLLNLAMRRADCRANIATWLLCGSACRPAHACPPKTACPSSGRSSTCAGHDSAWSFLKSRKITKDAAPRLGACSGAPQRNVLIMACKIIQHYQISAKSGP